MTASDTPQEPPWWLQVEVWDHKQGNFCLGLSEEADPAHSEGFDGLTREEAVRLAHSLADRITETAIDSAVAHALTAARARIAELEQSEEHLMAERDGALECIDDVKDALGIESEWTSLYGFAEFVDEVEGHAQRHDERRARIEQLEGAIGDALGEWDVSPSVRAILERVIAGIDVCGDRLGDMQCQLAPGHDGEHASPRLSDISDVRTWSSALASGSPGAGESGPARDETKSDFRVDTTRDGRGRLTGMRVRHMPTGMFIDADPQELGAPHLTHMRLLGELKRRIAGADSSESTATSEPPVNPARINPQWHPSSAEKPTFPGEPDEDRSELAAAERRAEVADAAIAEALRCLGEVRQFGVLDAKSFDELDRAVVRDAIGAAIHVLMAARRTS